MINNLINVFKTNITWKDLIIIFLVLYLLYKINVVEKMSDSTNENIRQTVKDIYQVDVQAIKNLGDVAKTLLDTNETLILPFKVKITGGLEVDDQILINEGTSPDLLMLKHSNNDYFYYNKGGSLGKLNTEENTGAINKLNMDHVGNINATGDILTTGQNIAIKKDNKYMSRMHHNGHACYMDYSGDLNIRQNNNDGIPEGQIQIKGSELNGGNINGSTLVGSEAILAGTRFTKADGYAYIQSNEPNGFALSTIGGRGDTDIVVNNINANGKIGAAGQVEGSSLKSRDVVFTKDGWLRVDTSQGDNRILVNGKQNG